MKRFIHFLIFAFALVVIVKLGLVTGGMIVVICIVGGVVIDYRFKQRAKRRFYAEVFENLHVVTRDPVTGEEFDLPGDLEEFVIWCDHPDAIVTKRREEARLEKAGNVRFARTDDKKLKVLTHIFKHGEFINENFTPEFSERVIESIREDRAAVHGGLAAVSQDWYHRFADKQRAVVYEFDV